MERNHAFDAIADQYDQTFTETLTGRQQRVQVHTHLQQLFQDADIQHVLEVNCGTGVDACWLVQQGKTVLATDISAQMIAAADRKRQRLPKQLQESLQLQQVSANELKPGEQKYDLLFSNFGGLNCLSPAEIAAFFDNAAQLLRPGGYLIMVIMGRFCWWESLYFSLKGSFYTAFRRLRREPTNAQLDNQTSIPTWYYGPKDLATKGTGFQHHALCPIGFWLPPSYLDPFFQRRPGLFRRLNKLEKKTEKWSWLAYASDHYYLSLKRK